MDFSQPPTTYIQPLPHYQTFDYVDDGEDSVDVDHFNDNMFNMINGEGGLITVETNIGIADLDIINMDWRFLPIK